ncbi:outer membrane protein [Bartonella florencae]|uniref:outer membrane protein n=1 Tax=Bartonella florencae TaxID=928210 RepID=UPI0002D7BD1C|nr:outer membrane protein [Bartonella florencae]
MTKQYLIKTSIFSLILVSTVQAADVTIPEQPRPVGPIIAAPHFSWTGFYLGGQIGYFSSKTSANYLADGDTGRWDPIKKEFLPKLSGFVGGIYAGSNIDIDNSFVIGFDTDIMWSDKKDTKYISASDTTSSHVKTRAVFSEDSEGRRSEEILRKDDSTETITKVRHTIKQKWFGATRVRVGFPVDRVMPYIAGGVAYTQLRNIVAAAEDTNATSKAADFSDWVHDEKTTMIGYTLGGGVDYAVTDNVILRAEYRYSDFGKKKFVHDKVEMSYKTNDFRVGVAYKF